MEGMPNVLFKTMPDCFHRPRYPLNFELSICTPFLHTQPTPVSRQSHNHIYCILYIRYPYRYNANSEKRKTNKICPSPTAQIASSSGREKRMTSIPTHLLFNPYSSFDLLHQNITTSFTREQFTNTTISS